MHQIASEAREIQGWKAKLLRHFPVVPTNKPSRNGWIDIYVLIYASTCPNSKHKTSNIVPLIFLTHQDQHHVARVPWVAVLVVQRLGPVEEVCRVWGEHLIIFLFCRIIPLLANYIYTVFDTAEECVPPSHLPSTGPRQASLVMVSISSARLHFNRGGGVKTNTLVLLGDWGIGQNAHHLY